MVFGCTGGGLSMISAAGCERERKERGGECGINICLVALMFVNFMLYV